MELCSYWFPDYWVGSLFMRRLGLMKVEFVVQYILYST